MFPRMNNVFPPSRKLSTEVSEDSEERLFFRAAPSVRAAVELQALLRGEGLEEIKQGERMDLAGCRMYE
jgi:hypothetical protein